MYIKSVKLVNFRSYGEREFNFGDSLNVIYGENASGKTNALESIYFSGLGKSPRTNNEKELIKWGSDIAYIKVIVSKRFRDHTLEFYLDDKGKKRITIDKLPLQKIGELIGFLNIVFFSPDEMRLIKESPAERRRFMDISLSQQKKTYFYSLMKYNRIIAQRNKQLKTTRDISVLKSTLPIWDTQLAAEGAKIIKDRYSFIEKISAYAAEKHSSLTGGKETLTIEYETKIENMEESDIKVSLEKMYADSFDKDVNLYYTTAGPHRDDLKLCANGVDIRKYGSQGQQRTVALSLKLGEIINFERETGEKPILLLDDVLSELDSTRQNSLLKATDGVQTILTCTEFDMDKSANKILILKDDK